MKCFRLHATFTNCVDFPTLKRTVTQATFFTLKRALKKQVFISLPQASLVLNTLPPGRSRKGKKEGILGSFLFNFSGGISSIQQIQPQMAPNAQSCRGSFFVILPLFTQDLTRLSTEEAQSTCILTGSPWTVAGSLALACSGWRCSATWTRQQAAP